MASRTDGSLTCVQKSAHMQILLDLSVLSAVQVGGGGVVKDWGGGV